MNGLFSSWSDVSDINIYYNFMGKIFVRQNGMIEMFLICGFYVFIYGHLNHVTQGRVDNYNGKNKRKSLVLFCKLNFILSRKMNGFSNTNHSLWPAICALLRAMIIEIRDRKRQETLKGEKQMIL